MRFRQDAIHVTFLKLLDRERSKTRGGRRISRRRLRELAREKVAADHAVADKWINGAWEDDFSNVVPPEAMQ